MNRSSGNRMPTRDNWRDDPGETGRAARETMNTQFCRRPIAVLIALLFLASVILSSHAGAETVAGISAGPAKVCPDPGCTCMPEAQATSLGYIRCSVNETPCFRDSLSRPLYCFHAPSSKTCDALGCDGSGRINGSPSESIRLVITMQAYGTQAAACGETGSDVCALPGEGLTPEVAAADPFGSILLFFRSLFGIQ